MLSQRNVWGQMLADISDDGALDSSIDGSVVGDGRIKELSGR